MHLFLGVCGWQCKLGCLFWLQELTEEYREKLEPEFETYFDLKIQKHNKCVFICTAKKSPFDYEQNQKYFIRLNLFPVILTHQVFIKVRRPGRRNSAGLPYFMLWFIHNYVWFLVRVWLCNVFVTRDSWIDKQLIPCFVVV